MDSIEVPFPTSNTYITSSLITIINYWFISKENLELTIVEWEEIRFTYNSQCEQTTELDDTSPVWSSVYITFS